MNTIEKATLLALKAHEGQMRKEASIPYIVHPIAVGFILSEYDFDEEVVAAGIVHDTVEDTPVTLDEIREELGERIAAIVAPVTHDDTLGWKEKKEEYIASVRAGSEDAKAVATADKIANARSLLDAHAVQGVEVWNHFNAGKDMKLWFENEMLKMLEETWDHPLVGEYKKLVDKMNVLD